MNNRLCLNRSVLCVARKVGGNHRHHPTRKTISQTFVHAGKSAQNSRLSTAETKTAEKLLTPIHRLDKNYLHFYWDPLYLKRQTPTVNTHEKRFHWVKSVQGGF